MNELKLKREDIYRGHLILVNRDNPIKQPFDTRLIKLENRRYPVMLQSIAAAMFDKTLQAISGQKNVILVSGYRSKEEQEQIFEDSLKENGKAFTNQYVAFPNHSEHQTGLAIDVGLNKEVIDFIRPDFPYSGICQSFREESIQYGFVQRYKEDKESITHIAHEPWHFRYVGYPHSLIMEKKQMALEEYIEDLKQYAYDKQPLTMVDSNFYFEIFYIAIKDQEEIQIKLPNCTAYQVSGNNQDGFIVTLWKERRKDEWIHTLRERG